MFLMLMLRHYYNIYFMNLLFRYAFSEDGGPTIIPKPDPYIPIGQRDGPSALDLHKINVLYDCGKWIYTLTGRSWEKKHY